MAIDASQRRLPFRAHPLRRLSRPLPLGAGLAAAAVAMGAGYAVSAYALDPRVLPLAAVALASVLLGLWRLEFGLALLLLLTPLAENAPIAEPAQAPLRVALSVWCLSLAAVQAVRVALTDHHVRAPAASVAAAVFLGAALITVPSAAEAGSAAAKFLLLAGSVTTYLLIGVFLTTWRHLRRLTAALVGIGLLVATHGILQYLTGELSGVGFVTAGGSVEYRIASFFPHPNQLAGFAVLMVPIGLGVAGLSARPAWRAMCVLLALLSSIVVFLTLSRGAIVALAALPLLYLRRREAWPVLLAVAAFIAFFAPSTLTERVAAAGPAGSEAATRLDFWRGALDMFDAHPFVGVGLNNFEASYLGFERPGRSFVGGEEYLEPPDTAHNLYLNTVAEQGLIGAASFLLLAVAVARLTLALRRSSDPRRQAIGRALAGVGLVLAVHGLLDVTFWDAKTLPLVWAVIGVGAAAYRAEERQEQKAAD